MGAQRIQVTVHAKRNNRHVIPRLAVPRAMQQNRDISGEENQISRKELLTGTTGNSFQEQKQCLGPMPEQLLLHPEHDMPR